MTDPDIYVAGSIRGGRSTVSLYAALVELLGAHGTVLTEHVGDEDVKADEADDTDAEIHDRDLTWLRQADVVVAEVTTPSLGVGYELGRAVAWDKPVLCLYRPDGEHALSAMVRGNPALSVVTYRSPDEIATTVERFVTRHS